MTSEEAYREIGRIRGRELRESVVALVATWEGIRESLDAGRPTGEGYPGAERFREATRGMNRPGEEGRMTFGRAWDCAHAEAGLRDQLAHANAERDADGDSWANVVNHYIAERNGLRADARRVSGENDALRALVMEMLGTFPKSPSAGPKETWQTVRSEQVTLSRVLDWRNRWTALRKGDAS